MKHVLSLIGKEVRDEERHERRIKNRKVEEIRNKDYPFFYSHTPQTPHRESYPSKTGTYIF